jgi:single-strand DNA-binding protein
MRSLLLTQITVIGNLTADPELRFTPSGQAVAKFRIASTPRTFDKASDSWKDGEPLFLDCSAWQQTAENVAESLKRGMRVVVQGTLSQRSYEKDGVQRTVYELKAAEIGPSLTFASAVVTKVPRTSGVTSHREPADDPWATATPARQNAGGVRTFDDEPPF